MNEPINKIGAESGIDNQHNSINKSKKGGAAAVLRLALLGCTGATAAAIAPIQQVEASEASFSVNELNQQNREYLNNHFFITPDNTEADVVNWFRRNRGIRSNADLYSAMDNRIHEKVQSSINNVGQENVEKFMKQNSISNVSYLPKAVQRFQYRVLGDRNPAGILNRDIIDSLDVKATLKSSTEESIKVDVPNFETNTLQQISENMNASKNLIGDNEFDFFVYYFNISNEQDFDHVVKDIQKKYKLGKVDGVIGPKTLEGLYNHIYSKDLSNMPKQIRDRYEAAQSLEQYYTSSKNPRKLPISGIGNAYSMNYFYGEQGTENAAGTAIDESLIDTVSPVSNINGGNSIQIKKLGNKIVTLMYVNGRLQVATYSSPGTYSHKTPTAGGRPIRVDGQFQHYISGSYPKRSSGINGGAVMPYAYGINRQIGIYGHVGNSNGRYRSHGCIRSPLFYQKAIFDNLSKYGSGNFKTIIDDIY